MFRETQEDYLRYLLFDDQEEDFDFFNSNNNASQLNSNMDANILFNQNDQVLETDNNPFSTNSVFNNNTSNKMNEFDKQQEDINQHLTEMTLNNHSVNEGGYPNSSNGNNLNHQLHGYRNNFSLNNNLNEQRPPFVGSTTGKLNNNGLSYDIRDNTDSSRFDEFANQPNSGSNGGYYSKQQIDNNNRGLNQSLYMQQTHLNSSQYNNYNGASAIKQESTVDYDPRMGSPIQNNNGYYPNSSQTQQQPNQQYDIMSSPNQQPANPYNEDFQNNSSNYYPDQQAQQQQQRDNRGYFSLDQQQANNGRGYYPQQQDQLNHVQSAAADSIPYIQGGYVKNEYALNGGYQNNGNNNNGLRQQQDGFINTNNQNNQQTQEEYFNNQGRQYPSTEGQTDNQYYNNQPVQQNGGEYRSTFTISNQNNYMNIQQQQQPYYQNFEISQMQPNSLGQQPGQDRPLGEVPILAEMRMNKRQSNTSKQSNGSRLSKKSSSIKEQQQQKYEKKYQKAQQSQKVQQQIINQITLKNQGASSATTLQYQTNGLNGNGESINASQYSSTDNNIPAEAVSSNNTVNNYTVPQFNQTNISQQSSTQPAENSYNQAYYNSYQPPSHHHCCHEDEHDSSDSEDEIEGEEGNQPMQSGFNDSNDEGKDKSDLSCDQEGDSEKNSKADEIAILAESIKHCNKKNVVKNIMSAFLTFMNDRKNKIYTKQEQECIPTLYYSIGKAEGLNEDEEQIEEIRKKFKRYISQKSLNHYTVRLLILHPNYGPIFKHYLTNPIKKWINNSKVADLGAHIKMIGFFLACFQDNRVLEELKRHEKKRAHFS